MSEPTLRPIWTPDDARQTVRDAEQHQAFRGDPVEPDQLVAAGIVEPDVLPFGRHRAPEPVGMRPRRALLLGRLLVAIAVLVLVLTIGVLWLVLA